MCQNVFIQHVPIWLKTLLCGSVSEVFPNVLCFVFLWPFFIHHFITLNLCILVLYTQIHNVLGWDYSLLTANIWLIIHAYCILWLYTVVAGPFNRKLLILIRCITLSYQKMAACTNSFAVFVFEGMKSLISHTYYLMSALSIPSRERVYLSFIMCWHNLKYVIFAPLGTTASVFIYKSATSTKNKTNWKVEIKFCTQISRSHTISRTLKGQSQNELFFLPTPCSRLAAKIKKKKKSVSGRAHGYMLSWVWIWVFWWKDSIPKHWWNKWTLPNKS